MTRQEKQIREVPKGFQIHGELLRAEACKIGHINETWSATYVQDGAQIRYLHQKINASVFKNPVALMKNIVRVTAHIRRKLEARGVKDLTHRVLTVVPARDGKSFWRDGAGE
jgi:hypothetical protein